MKPEPIKRRLVDDPAIFLQLTDFWEELFRLYDSKTVTNKYGACTPENPEVEYWAELLTELSPREVQLGLKGIRKHLKHSYVVNRDEFYKLATKNRRISPAHKPFQKLLPKTTQAERQASAKIHLATAKKLIAGV